MRWLRWANESPFGLGASVWSREHAAARARSPRGWRPGWSGINDHAYSFGAVADAVGRPAWLRPRHGRRRGTGSTRCRDRKFVDTDRGRLTPGWWYPYWGRAVDGSRGCSAALYADGLGSRAPRGLDAPPRPGPPRAARSSDERALARRRVDRRGADGRRRREAARRAVARSRGAASGWRRRRPRDSARSRRATRWPSHGSPASRRRSGRAS